MKDKPWIKATSGGALRIDTSHPEWQKQFFKKIEDMKRFTLLKETPTVTSDETVVKPFYQSSQTFKAYSYDPVASYKKALRERIDLERDRIKFKGYESKIISARLDQLERIVDLLDSQPIP